jgi:hypothetical protein
LLAVAIGPLFITAKTANIATPKFGQISAAARIAFCGFLG